MISFEWKVLKYKFNFCPFPKSTIKENNKDCNAQSCNTDLSYGMNENLEYYEACKRRARNSGLFVADQRLRGNTAIYTRQNPNGERFAYECPEERDYYPYWSPTKWVDIAILTNNVSQCEFYRAESENVKSRFYCSVPAGYDKQPVPISADLCQVNNMKISCLFSSFLNKCLSFEIQTENSQRSLDRVAGAWFACANLP